MATSQPNAEQFSELRQDLVSGEWVVISTVRGKRPDDFAERVSVVPDKKSDCSFEEAQDDAKVFISEEGEVVTGKLKNKKWFVQVIPNRFPAFQPSNQCPKVETVGPYHWMKGVGFQEVIITRYHDRPIAAMTTEEVELLVHAYQQRFQVLSKEDCVSYISIFQNHGPLAGASVFHPHSQLVATPVVPPDVQHSLAGVERYYKLHKQCVHCVVLAFELQEHSRIIFENDEFLAICPFAPRVSFEMRIFPKRHEAVFSYLPKEHRRLFAEALHAVLSKLAKALNDPSYNFFLHSAPQKDSALYHHYHWHLEIFPRRATRGGFELSTGMEISDIRPEDAATFLNLNHEA